MNSCVFVTGSRREGGEEEEGEEVIVWRDCLNAAMKERCWAVVSGERYTEAEKSSGPLRVVLGDEEDEEDEGEEEDCDEYRPVPWERKSCTSTGQLPGGT
jgi:hypothetical protein